MIIQDPILSPYYIRVTSVSYDVVEEAVSSPSDKGNGGREYEIPRGYYSSLANALKKVIALKAATFQSEEEVVTLKEYILTYKRIAREIIDTVKH